MKTPFVDPAIMAAFNFTEKDRTNLAKAVTALTRATTTASDAMKKFGIVADKIKTVGSLKEGEFMKK